MLESKVAKHYPHDTLGILWHQNEKAEAEANLAFVFIEHWGMVAGEIDGEDSAGRQKLRLLTPEEIVDRAFIIAHTAIDRARSLGLIHQGPKLTDLSDD